MAPLKKSVRKVITKYGKPFHRRSGRGLVVRVLDSSRVFDPRTGHGSRLKLRQFCLPQFASVYSAANEYQHCWEVPAHLYILFIYYLENGSTELV